MAMIRCGTPFGRTLLCSRSLVDVLAITTFEACTVGGFLLFRTLVGVMDKWREKPNRILLSVFVSGIVFGLLHLFSLGSAPVPYVIQQIISAGALGVFFGAVYVRTRNLWVPVLFHTLFDAMLFMFILPSDTVIFDYVIVGFAAVFFTAVALYLLRPAKRKEIEAAWFDPPAENA